MDFIIQTRNLTKKYNDLLAVNQLNISVKKGEIFGLIGPNGAGKTTTVKMLTTLLPQTAGSVTINGYDTKTQSKSVRKSIGYVPQDVGIDEIMTGREHLILQGKLHHIDLNTLNQRIEEVLSIVGLTKDANRRTLEYSGGMRKLLDIAAGLLHKPRILFMDEPTSGVDVEKRLFLTDYFKQLPEAFDTTIFLTTHFLEEADQICDRVAILDQGRIVVQGSPVELKSQLGNAIISIKYDRGEQSFVQNAMKALKTIPSVTHVVSGENSLKAFAKDDQTIYQKISSLLISRNLPPQALAITKPTLDDVFLKHLGKEIN